MEVRTDRFYQNAGEALRNPQLQRSLHQVTSRFLGQREAAFAELPNAELLRKRARTIKEETCRQLEEQLDRLEASVCRAGGVVFRARDGAEACRYIVELARRHGVKRAVKSKSMTAEEIGLNEALEQAGVEPVETDLGEYIIQLAGEGPSHIIAPAIHKSRAEVAELFAERLGTERSAEISQLTQIARATLREKFLTAEMGISGANFAVAETGTLTILENEGNARLCTTLPPIHVALMGMEKVIPALEDLSVFLKLLPRSATGQKISSYVSLITGPRRPTEVDGPEELHLVILDNGRSHLLGDPDLREALYCLRCGACLNVCPVYQKIGGHAYGWVYPGPIGSVLTPQFVGLHRARDLPYASTLCGACREVCPVQIDLPRLLLRLRWDLAGGRRQRSSRPSHGLLLPSPVRADEGKEDPQKEAVSQGSPTTPPPFLRDFRTGSRGPETTSLSLPRAPWGERVLMALWATILRSPDRYRRAARLVFWLQRPWVRGGKLRQLPFPWSGWTQYRDFPAVARRPFRERWKELSEEEPRHPGASAPGYQQVSPLPGVPQPAVLTQGSGEGRERETGPGIDQLARELARVGAKAYRIRSSEEARLWLRALVQDHPIGKVAHWEAPSPAAGEIHRALAGLEVEVIPARGGSPERLAGAEMGITGAEYALADTGTLVLVARAGQGRAVSLLPWVHVAWTTADRILPGLDELFARIRETRLTAASSCLTLITGPSRTADIELTLTIGVHGPGEVHLGIIE